MSVGLLVVLVLLAVGAGAVVGKMANRQLEGAGDKRGELSAADRARDAATASVIRLWNWNRERKKKLRDDP